MRTSRRSRGQNILEYILLVMAVVVVVIAAMAKNGVFMSTVNTALKSTQGMVADRQGELKF